ncbi:MAG: response regulator [Oligoflexia bacterium]|nr:response regulator [Oligoflexia bacterium]
MEEEKKYVLIVDDENEVREVIEGDLEGLGFIIYHASSASEALKVLADRSRIHAVLIDVNMPDISGIDLVKMIYERGIDSSLLLVTGFGKFEHVQTCIDCGVFDFIQKPYEKSYFINRVSRAVEMNISKNMEIQMLEKISTALKINTNINIKKLKIEERVELFKKVLQLIEYDANFVDKISKMKVS